MVVIKMSLIIAITLVSVINSMPVNEIIPYNDETIEDINNIIDYDDVINNYRSRAMGFAGVLPGAMKLPHNVRKDLIVEIIPFITYLNLIFSIRMFKQQSSKIPMEKKCLFYIDHHKKRHQK